MRIIAVINQKGGCGKTTTAINLAASFAHMGKATLLVDMDPQSHCALGLAVPERQIKMNIGDALLAGNSQAFEPDDLIWQVSSHLDLIPSAVSLAAIEQQLASANNRDLRLTAVLEKVKGKHEICIIDCPPSIGLLTFNALRAATEIIIPVETGFFAFKGAIKQATTLRAVTAKINHTAHLHVLATMYDVRTKQAREILKQLRKHFGDRVLPSPIHYSTKLKEAASFGQPITEFDPSSRACQDYEQLAKHLLANVPQAQLNQVVADENGTPVSTDTPQNNARQAITDRASELVQRAKALAERTAAMRQRLEADPHVQRVDAEQQKRQELPTDELSRQRLQAKINQLLGVKNTQQGTLFCQPLNGESTIHIAGDFNEWKPEQGLMKRNEKIGVWELCMDLEPGRYRYRILVDGKWHSDPHNTYVESNPFGELNSIVEIN